MPRTEAVITKAMARLEAKIVRQERPRCEPRPLRFDVMLFGLFNKFKSCSRFWPFWTSLRLHAVQFGSKTDEVLEMDCKLNLESLIREGRGIVD